MNRLILIEGIPGSGKTIYARRLEKYFKEKGLSAKCYLEGDSHPADLAWCAVLTDVEYFKLIEDYPNYSKKIMEISFVESEKHIVPYLSIGIRAEHKALWSFLESREIFNGVYSIDNFAKINLGRWSTFSKNSSSEEKVIIFESVFMQNHLTEIILFNDYNYELIYKYIDNLRKAVLPLEPLLIYLNQNNVKRTIADISMKRKNPDGNQPDWIDQVTAYIENSPFGKKSGKTGIDCLIAFLELRKSLENRLFNDLNMQKIMIHDTSLNYEKGFDEIVESLEKINQQSFVEKQRIQ